jgi:hypothetical protein
MSVSIGLALKVIGGYGRCARLFQADKSLS